MKPTKITTATQSRLILVRAEISELSNQLKATRLNAKKLIEIVREEKAEQKAAKILKSLTKAKEAQVKASIRIQQARDRIAKLQTFIAQAQTV